MAHVDSPMADQEEPIKGDLETKPSSEGSIVAQFHDFRAQLDEHHDRREKIIKASRDITASSKKM